MNGVLGVGGPRLEQYDRFVDGSRAEFAQLTPVSLIALSHFLGSRLFKSECEERPLNGPPDLRKDKVLSAGATKSKRL